jgi:dephospho-CoA kinase
VIAVYDVPLLVEGNLAEGFDVVVVVEADVETRVQRLVARGMAEADARARMAAQATDEQRRAVAHEVISNDGGRDALEAQIEQLWRRLLARHDGVAQEEPS